MDANLPTQALNCKQEGAMGLPIFLAYLPKHAELQLFSDQHFRKMFA